MKKIKVDFKTDKSSGKSYGFKYLIFRTCYLVYLFSIIWHLVSGISLHGAFLDPGWGARPTAMGGAYTALSDDSNGMLYNPAGTARARRTQATFMYSKPYLNLDLVSGPDTTELGMNYGSALYPFVNWGTVGLGATSFSSSGLYRENAYILNYAVPTQQLKEFFSRFKSQSAFGSFGTGGWSDSGPSMTKLETHLGMNIKYLSHEYTLDRYAEIDPVFESGNSASAISLDFGILVLLNNKYSFGLALKDFNGPDVGISEKDKVPAEFRLGTALLSRKFRPCLDISFRDKLFNAHLGTEYVIKALALRCGGNLDELAAGFGISIGILSMDYSFIWPLYIQESYGTHRAALTFRFAERRKEAEEEPSPSGRTPSYRQPSSKEEKKKEPRPKKIKPKKVKTEKIKPEKEAKPEPAEKEKGQEEKEDKSYKGYRKRSYN
ncbi:MAG: hypothetical protein JXJ19_01835 [Elusimicrobia bacterium]|nr:hypothetical protein [Elusimicrobiota bacterium]